MNGNKPLSTSVIVCTHNGREFLAEQLESILNQTVPPNEIVISDDDSSDGTLDLARSIISDAVNQNALLSALRVEYISNIPALGVAANFVSAMAVSSGDVLFLSDQDDAWFSTKLEQMLQRFEADPELLLLHTNALLVDGAGKSLRHSLFDALRVSLRERQEIHQGHAFNIYMRRNLVTGATLAVRRQIVDIVRNLPAGWLHDEYLGLVAASRGKVDVIEQELISYRQHGRNLIGISKPGLFQHFEKVFYPGKARNEELLDRANALSACELFASDQLDTGKAILVREKLVHEENRSRFCVNRIRRIPQVIREIKSGRYGTVGMNFLDIVRDFLQPLG